MYDYAIIGGGITGLTLSYFLAKNNYKVILIEKEDKLGGCWKQEWIEDKYFSEHSPRVLIKNDNFYRLLREINYDIDKNTTTTYGNIFETNFKLLNFFYDKFTFRELLILMKSKIFGVEKNITVSEYFNKYNFSEKGRKALTIISIVIANSPNKLLVSELFGESNNIPMFYQFKNADWIDIFENKLIEMKVDILKNTEINNINNINNINANKYILTLPPIAFKRLVDKNDLLKDNWMDYNLFNKWVENSYYISFGFQLHFDNYIKFNRKWCWSCMDEYNLIILPTSEYLDIYTKDENVKTVWSCTIVDTSVYINKFKKTVDEMTKEEIINDIIERLNVKPYKYTFSEGLEKINNRWISKDSSFSLSKYGIINPKGKIDNIYTVGSHNTSGITTIGKAVDNAIYFLENNNIKTFEKQNSIMIYILSILIIIICIYLLIYKENSGYCLF
jgi:hypothetical protein